jgi:hypothetical protein
MEINFSYTNYFTKKFDSSENTSYTSNMLNFICGLVCFFLEQQTLPSYYYWSENCYDAQIAASSFSIAMLGPSIDDPALMCTERTLMALHLPTGKCENCDVVDNALYICKMPTTIACEIPNETICYQYLVQEIPCNILFDMDEDDDVDLNDFAVLQNGTYKCMD